MQLASPRIQVTVLPRHLQHAPPQLPSKSSAADVILHTLNSSYGDLYPSNQQLSVPHKTASLAILHLALLPSFFIPPPSVILIVHLVSSEEERRGFRPLRLFGHYSMSR